jgi:hypothetical protein
MTVVSLLQRVLGVQPNPITPKSVRPSSADRDSRKEAVLSAQQDAFLREYNQSVYLRKELAECALRIVGGER